MSVHYRIDVDTQALMSAQDRLTELATALTGRADQLDAAPGSMPVWQGAARTAVMTEVAALAGHTRGFAPLFTAAAEGLAPFITAVVDAEANVLPDLDYRRQAALNLYDDDVRQSQAQRTTAYDDIPADAGAQRRMWQMEADSAHSYRTSEAAAVRDGKLTGLDAEYAELVARLETAAAAASDAVAAAVVAVAPDQTVANALGGGGRMPLVDLFYDLATESRQAGIAAAQQLLEQGVDASADLIRDIAERQDDPAFAAGFASAASPEQLSRLVMQWSGTRQAMVSSLATPEQLDAYDRRYRDVIAAVSGTLGTATRGTGQFAPPDGYTEQWVDLLTGDLATEGGEVLLGQSAAASLLLTRGTFSTPFLDRVATAVYDYERSAGGRPVWGPRASDGSYVGDVVAPFGRSGVDVMANVLHGLAGNAEAAQRFFTGGGVVDATVLDHDVEVQERLKYLLQDRRWPYDDADGLGAALVAATTERRGPDEAGRTSATLAAQAFALAGAVDEEGHGGRSLQEGLRDDVAKMLASYGSDVTLAALPLESGGVASDYTTWTRDEAGGGYGAQIDRQALERLLGTLGEDPEHLGVVASGVAAASRLAVDELLAVQMASTDGQVAVDLLSGTPVPDLQGTSARGAVAAAQVLAWGQEGQEDDQEAQAARAAAVSRAIGAVAALPPLQVAGYGGFAVGRLVELSQTAVTDAPPTGVDDYTAMSQQMREQLSGQLLDQLLQHGYLAPEVYAAAGRTDAPGPGVVTSVDGVPRVSFGSQAYSDWSLRDADGWVQDWVIGPYAAAMPDFDG
ncbi:hypothetical protein WDZ16_11745 [Pseudokineococcus marinus]|uniref:Uncharacterized protein n=1 Tax=Pseudokineococcus marinus TaxID=351215 RepID=A0A849BGR8_9ACTN|nr:hypothetical protein [Pseudokineococcus marinus]NNH22300.1 hypothetical protein [Pseudokineococcus marinus]